MTDANGWQTIETAPRDRAILTFAPQAAARYAVGWFLKDMNDAGAVIVTWRDDGETPTHWAPLPPPPEAA